MLHESRAVLCAPRLYLCHLNEPGLYEGAIGIAGLKNAI